MTVSHDYSQHHVMISHTGYCNPKVSDGIGYLKRHWNILTNIAYPYYVRYIDPDQMAYVFRNSGLQLT